MKQKHDELTGSYRPKGAIDGIVNDAKKKLGAECKPP